LRQSPIVSNALPALQIRNLGEQIADAIVKAAAEGVLRPGDRLFEEELASQFGVSRVPVREALKLLESRGVTISSPNRGMRLATFDEQQLQQILIVRVSLEKLAVEEIQKSLSGGRPLETEGMEVALEKMKRAARDRNPYAVTAADIAFHRALVAASNNAIVVQFWEMLAARLTVILGLATSDKNLQRVYRNHHAIYELVRGGDVARTQHAIEENIMEPTQWQIVKNAMRQGAGEANAGNEETTGGKVIFQKKARW
jgi:DNA-binding GntR family transcriptional regulator